MSYRGITLELIGDSGSGKTTQAGELAKHVWKTRKKRSILHTADRGGYDSIAPLVRLGIVILDELQQDDDPWIWVNRSVSGALTTDDIGLEIFDSGSSFSDVLLTACARSDWQIGQQKTQKFVVSKGAENLTVPINNPAHYGVVQQFMLEKIRNSTWLTRRGVDVMWNFVLQRSEGQDRGLILGPKLCGNAMTPFLPKEFGYTFRIDSIPQEGTIPVHRLYLSEHPELAGMGHSFGNARFPLGVDPLPAYIEPASIPEALRLIEEGQKQADLVNAQELGLG